MYKCLPLILSLLHTVLITGQDQKIFSIYFGFDEINLEKSQQLVVDSEVIPFLKKHEVTGIKIYGNTDSVSSSQYNIALGLERANSVRAQLSPYFSEEIECKSLGKSSPKFSNETEEGRKSNRRVDIVITYQSEKPNQIVSNKIEEKPFENDTIIRCEDGVELHIKAETFYPSKTKDVTITTREALSPLNIIRNNLSTMTADGRCLESGGMIFTSAEIDGVPTQPNDSITVRIPASKIDTNMKIWDVEVVDGDTLWVESDLKLTFNEEEKYYEFKTSRMPSINVDVPVASTVADGISGLLKVFKDDNTTIKARGKQFVECYLVSDDELIVLRGELIKPKKSHFEPCLTDPNDIVIAHVKKKDKDFYMVKPLGAIKLKQFFNRFVIRKRDLKDIDSFDQYEHEVEEVCEHLTQ